MIGKRAAGSPLHVSVRLMSSYAKEWLALVAEMHDQTMRALFGETPTMDARGPFDSMLEQLEKRFAVLFAGAALKMAPRQIMAVDEQAVRDLGMSLRDVSKHLTLKSNVFSGPLQDTIRGAVSDNVDLITRIPRDYLAKIKQDVEASIGPGGKGLQSLVPVMEARYGEAKRWANHVAHDQTRKAYTAINATRCESSGIEEAEWVHTMGSNAPRPYHIARAPNGLNGLIFRFDKPPIIDLKTGERGLPGHAIFCHCTFRPIINLKKFAEAS